MAYYHPHPHADHQDRAYAYNRNKRINDNIHNIGIAYIRRDGFATTTRERVDTLLQLSEIKIVPI